MDLALIAANSNNGNLADQTLAQAVGRKTKATILLVEDDSRVRQVTAEVLTMVGYTVLEARNADEALQIFEKHAEDVQLLLTDVVMPGKNGRELARQLTARCPALKTIFVSGYGKNSALLAADTDPSVFYLSKPFSVPSLIQKVEFALGNADRTALCRSPFRCQRMVEPFSKGINQTTGKRMPGWPVPVGLGYSHVSFTPITSQGENPYAALRGSVNCRSYPGANLFRPLRGVVFASRSTFLEKNLVRTEILTSLCENWAIPPGLDFHFHSSRR